MEDLILEIKKYGEIAGYEAVEELYIGTDGLGKAYTINALCAKEEDFNDKEIIEFISTTCELEYLAAIVRIKQEVSHNA